MASTREIFHGALLLHEDEVLVSINLVRIFVAGMNSRQRGVQYCVCSRGVDIKGKPEQT